MCAGVYLPIQLILLAGGGGGGGGICDRDLKKATNQKKTKLILMSVIPTCVWFSGINST